MTEVIIVLASAGLFVLIASVIVALVMDNYFKIKKKMNKKYRINEIFESIQGEGVNTGMHAVFIRLSGCNFNCDFCDTDHSTFFEMTSEELLSKIKKEYPNAKNIIWTGGEPTLQLTTETLKQFTEKGFINHIETNGSNPVPSASTFGYVDYIACSPKVPADVLYKNFGNFDVDEFRYPIKEGDEIPDIKTLPHARHYYLSPIDGGDLYNESADIERIRKNINYCLNHIINNPQWKLSIQMHKLLKVR